MIIAECLVRLSNIGPILVRAIYEDDNTEDQIEGDVRIGNSDLVLNVSIGNITIGDFNVNLDLNWTNVGDEEENFLTNYGILVESPEDSIEDQEFRITVPKEQLEVSISLLM